MKIRKEGFGNTDLNPTVYIVDPDVAESIIQTLARIMGWDANNKLWRSLLSDVDGRLLVSTSPTQSNLASNANPTIGLLAGVVLPANPSRKQYIIQNLGSADIYLGFGVTPVVGTHLKLASGGIFIDDVFTGTINGISGTAGQSVIAVEM